MEGLGEQTKEKIIFTPAVHFFVHGRSKNDHLGPYPPQRRMLRYCTQGTLPLSQMLFSNW